MMIDVKNYRQYSSKELQEFAYKGLLECNGADLSSFLEYFCGGLISKEHRLSVLLWLKEKGYMTRGIVRAGMPVRLIEVKY